MERERAVNTKSKKAAKTLAADFASTTEANWQLTNLLAFQADAQSKKARRVFISSY